MVAITSVKSYILLLSLYLLQHVRTDAFPAETLISSTVKPTPILRNYEVESTGDIHKFSYRISDQAREETVEVINSGTPEEEIKIYGYYSFVDDSDAQYFYRVDYISDRNGYNATINRFQVEFQVLTKRVQPILLKSLVG